MVVNWLRKLIASSPATNPGLLKILYICPGCGTLGEAREVPQAILDGKFRASLYPTDARLSRWSVPQKWKMRKFGVKTDVSTGCIHKNGRKFPPPSTEGRHRRRPSPGLGPDWEEYIGGRTGPHLGDINLGAEGQHGPIYGGSADDKNRFLTGNSCKGFPRAVDNPGSGNFRISPGED